MSHVFGTLPTPSTFQSEHLYLAQVRVGNTEVSDFGQPLLTSEWRNKGKRMERAEDRGAGPLQTGELPTPPHQVGALAISWISSTIGHVPCPCVYKPETGSSGEESFFKDTSGVPTVHWALFLGIRDTLANKTEQGSFAQGIFILNGQTRNGCNNS